MTYICAGIVCLEAIGFCITWHVTRHLPLLPRVGICLVWFIVYDLIDEFADEKT